MEGNREVGEERPRRRMSGAERTGLERTTSWVLLVPVGAKNVEQHLLLSTKM